MFTITKSFHLLVDDHSAFASSDQKDFGDRQGRILMIVRPPCMTEREWMGLSDAVWVWTTCTTENGSRSLQGFVCVWHHALHKIKQRNCKILRRPDTLNIRHTHIKAGKICVRANIMHAGKFLVWKRLTSREKHTQRVAHQGTFRPFRVNWPHVVAGVTGLWWALPEDRMPLTCVREKPVSTSCPSGEVNWPHESLMWKGADQLSLWNQNWIVLSDLKARLFGICRNNWMALSTIFVWKGTFSLNPRITSALSLEWS